MSGPVVLKFGGSSVATASRLRRIAAAVDRRHPKGQGVVIVVSAMGKTTDKLLALAHAVSSRPLGREVDMLLSSGETITAPLLAMALAQVGRPALSLTGMQAGITTDGPHRHARIKDIHPKRIEEALARGEVVVVAGFQGSTPDLDVTTLGRGGSDTTAVALAAALKAPICTIYTDVDGVYSADPRVVSNARVIDHISYSEMMEMAALGAAVMHPRAVEIGEAYSIPIEVRSTFGKARGTLISNDRIEQRHRVRGITHEVNVAKLTVEDVPDRPGLAAHIFSVLGAEGVNVDTIVQNVARGGLMDLSFTVAESELPHVRPLLAAVTAQLGGSGIETDSNVAKVSVVGTGMLHTPGTFATMFTALAKENINIQMISTSEIRVTCIIDESAIERAVNALHRAYQLEEL